MPCQAKVGELEFCLAVVERRDEHVGRLHVAVIDAGLRTVLEINETLRACFTHLDRIGQLVHE